MSDEAWWVPARLSDGGSGALAEGSLAEMIWLALDLPPAEQRAAVVEATTTAEVILYEDWKALSEQADFPTCI